MAGVMSRADWAARRPQGARRFDPAKVLGVAVHYNGPAVPASALTDPRELLRGIQRFHQDTRGWADIAYNLAVDATGRVWTLRGLLTESAANGNAKLNDQWVAVFAVLGGDQQPTAPMLAGIRYAVGLVRAKYPHAVRVIGHRDIRSTDCPGDALYRHVRAGTFNPPRPSPAPVAPEEGNFMANMTQREFNAYLENAHRDEQVRRGFRELARDGAEQWWEDNKNRVRAHLLGYPERADDPATPDSEARSLLNLHRDTERKLDELTELVQSLAAGQPEQPPSPPEA